MNSPWVVGNGAHNRFRAMGNGGQIFWVTEVDLAMQFARRIDAENFAEGDEDAWQIIQIAALQEEQVDCGLEYAPGSDVAALAEVMEQKVADLHGRLQAMMEPFNAKESLERLKAEGFTTSSPEYLAAQLYFNQEPSKFEAEESLRRLKEWKLPCTNWELSNRLQEVELMDILQLLARQEITASKALEAIHSRVAGNEPALPEMGSGMEAQPDSSNSVQLVPEEQVKISPLEGELTARLVTAFEAKGAKVVLLQKDITLQELERIATSYETKGQPGTAPKINVKFEVIAGIATGTYYADVKRVEQEDDGSFTAVLATKAPYAFADCPDPSLEAATAPVTLSAERAANPVHSLLHAWEPDFSEGEPAVDSKLCGLCGRTDDEYHVPRVGATIVDSKELQTQIDGKRFVIAQMEAGVSKLAALLQGACDHSKTSSYQWEFDNGYGKQHMNEGRRCKYCGWISLYNDGRWAKPEDVTV